MCLDLFERFTLGFRNQQKGEYPSAHADQSVEPEGKGFTHQICQGQKSQRDD